MSIIRDPFFLEELSTKISALTAENDAVERKLHAQHRSTAGPLSLLLGGFAPTKVVLKALNDHYGAVPELISITPEIALFIAEDNAAFVDKVNLVDKKEKPMLTQFLAANKFAMSIIFPGPHSLHTMGSFANDVSKLKSYASRLEELGNERSQIVANILSVYRLKKVGEDYVLARGTWEERSRPGGRAVEHYNAICNIGIWQDFDIGALRKQVQAKVGKAR